LNSDITTVDEWRTVADKYLYEAKADGRNRCRVDAIPMALPVTTR
jgi:PleD family two-component response regulator